MLKLNLVYFLLFLMFCRHLFAMDLSGIETRNITFNPAPENTSNLDVYQSHFQKRCPERFGAGFRFSGFVIFGAAPSQEQKRQYDAIQAAMNDAVRNQDTFTYLALEQLLESLLIKNDRKTYTALCSRIGPSQKPVLERTYNRLRVAYEMLLLRLGYYDLKFKWARPSQ